MATSHLARAAGVLARAGIGLVVAALLAEALVRGLRVPPRRVVFEAANYGPFSELGGVVVWPDHGHAVDEVAQLEARACDVEGSFRVLVVGDSILNGIGVHAPEVGTVRLQQALVAEGVPACVRNLAVPGFSLWQGLARAAPELPTFRPHVVVLELWGGAPVRPVRVGSRVYQPHGQCVDVAGVMNPLGLPSAWNRGLLRSRLYEAVVLAWPDDCPGARDDLGAFGPVLDGFVAEVRAAGGEVVAVLPTRLDEPIGPGGRAARDARVWTDWLGRAGVRHVALWDAWAGVDPATIRLDDVHLDPAGHARLAGELRALVAPDVDRWRRR